MIVMIYNVIEVFYVVSYRLYYKLKIEKLQLESITVGFLTVCTDNL